MGSHKRLLSEEWSEGINGDNDDDDDKYDDDGVDGSGGVVTLTECLLFSNSCSKHFTHRNLFNPHSDPVRQV